MSAKEKNEMIISDSNVESLFVELENIFDNYDGYYRRLKAYEIINAAMYQCDGSTVANTESKCNNEVMICDCKKEWSEWVEPLDLEIQIVLKKQKRREKLL